MSANVRIKRPQLMPVRGDTIHELKQSVNRMSEAMQPLLGQNKNKLEMAVTFADLAASGFNVMFNPNGVAGAGPIVVPPNPRPDPEVPPGVLNFKASATWDTVILTWDASGYKRHAYVEIFRAPGFQDEANTVPTSITDAVLIGTSPTTGLGDSVISNHYYRYWARNVSSDGLKSDWHSEEGTVAFAPRSPRDYIDIISGEIRQDDLYITLGEKIDRIDELDAIPLLEQDLTETKAELTTLTNRVVTEEAATVELQTQLDAVFVTTNDLGDRITANGSLIVQNQNAISSANSAIATLQSTVQAQSVVIGDIDAELGQVSNDLGLAEGAILSHSGLIQSNTSAITDLESAQATLTTNLQALTGRVDTNENLIETNRANIAFNASAITSVESAQSSLNLIVQAHTSRLNSQGDSIAANTAMVSQHSSAITTLESASASYALQLQTNTTSIQQQASIIEAQGELVDASWTVKVDDGGVISGFGLMQDSTGFSRFAVRADRFYIAPPTGSPNYNDEDHIPFVVNGNDVLIKNAYIDNAFIQSLVTGELIANKIIGETIQGIHIRGGDISIGNNFTVDGAGNVVATNGFFEGTVMATDGVFTGTVKSSVVLGGRVEGSEGYFTDIGYNTINLDLNNYSTGRYPASVDPKRRPVAARSSVRSVSEYQYVLPEGTSAAGSYTPWMPINLLPYKYTGRYSDTRLRYSRVPDGAFTIKMARLIGGSGDNGFDAAWQIGRRTIGSTGPYEAIYTSPTFSDVSRVATALAHVSSQTQLPEKVYVGPFVLRHGMAEVISHYTGVDDEGWRYSRIGPVLTWVREIRAVGGVWNDSYEYAFRFWKSWARDGQGTRLFRIEVDVDNSIPLSDLFYET